MLNKQIHPVDAGKFIIENFSDEKIIMFNEAHLYLQTTFSSIPFGRPTSQRIQTTIYENIVCRTDCPQTLRKRNGQIYHKLA